MIRLVVLSIFAAFVFLFVPLFLFSFSSLLAVLGKPTALPFCVSPSHSHCPHTRTSDTSGSQLYGGFSPQQAVLCDTGWGSSNVTPFWHCLPGESVGAHRGGAQSHEAALLQVPVATQVVTCASDWPAIDQRFSQPPSWVHLICYSSSHSSKKHFTNWIMMHRATYWGKGSERPGPLWGRHPLPLAPLGAYQPRRSPNCPFGFLWKLRYIDHCTTRMKLWGDLHDR